MRRPLLRPDLYPSFDKLLFVLFVLLVPLAAGSSTEIFGDGDVSWHLATGQWILANGKLPATDPFSFTMAGRPWVTFEWLSQVLYQISFDIAGYAGVSALVAVTLMALHLVVFLRLRSRVGPIAILVALISMDLILAPFILARPHVLAWPLLAAWTSVLLGYRDHGRAPPLWLALVMLVWANLHGSFAIGFVIAAAFGLDALIEARWDRRVLANWLVFGLASLAAALLNANGLTGLLHPLTVMGMETLPLIGEWRPSTPERTPLFYAVLLATLGALLFKPAKLRIGELLLVLVLLAMAFSQVRHQSWLVVVAALVLTPHLGTLRVAAPAPFKSSDARLAAIASAAVAAIILLVARRAVPLQPEESRTTPKRLLASIPAELKAQPVLNEYSFGGPLILAGIRPYIDGRADMYGDDFFSEYLAIIDGDPQRFDRAVRKYGIRWTMLPPNKRLVRVLDASVEWRRIYADEIGIIHVRQRPDVPVASQPAEPDGLPSFTQR